MAEVVTRDTLADLWKAKVEKEDGGIYAKSRALDDVRWFFDTVSEHLAKGDEVHIHGFGNFRVVKREARVGRNPRTGEEVRIPARKAVRFAASTTLTASLAGRKAKR